MKEMRLILEFEYDENIMDIYDEKSQKDLIIEKIFNSLHDIPFHIPNEKGFWTRLKNIKLRNLWMTHALNYQKVSEENKRGEENIKRQKELNIMRLILP